MIAKYPPMGWNSWDCYGAAVKESDVRRNAQYMADKLKEYGWEYVVVDIQWYQPTAVNHDYTPFAELTMDGFGRLMPALNRFPSAKEGLGFKPLADFLHSLGLKFGIHIMRGLPRMAAHGHLPIEGSACRCDEAANPNDICAWNPDMYGLRSDSPAAKAYYESIFRLYAEWGVDFVKCDDIAREYPRCEREIELISNACRACGRDIILSLSPGPAPLERAEHLKAYANMWRITDDFWDRWDLLKGMFERAEKWCIHSSAGHWPDADMLPLGALRQCDDAGEWTRFSQAEQRTMMALWCMMRSPLMIGGELSKSDDFTLSLLQNRDLLDIQKQAFCAQPLHTTNEESVWLAPRTDGKGVYAALSNLSDAPRIIHVSQEALCRPFTIAKDIWTGQETRLDNGLSLSVAPHDTALFLLI